MDELIEEVSSFIGEDEYNRKRIVRALNKCDNDVEEAIAMLLDASSGDDSEEDLDECNINIDENKVDSSQSQINAKFAKDSFISSSVPLTTVDHTDFSNTKFSCVAKYILPSQPSSFLLPVSTKSNSFSFSLTQLYHSYSDIKLFSFTQPSPDDIAKYRLEKQTVKGRNNNLTKKQILAEMIDKQKENKNSLSSIKHKQLEYPSKGRHVFNNDETKNKSKNKKLSKSPSSITLAEDKITGLINLSSDLKRICRHFSSVKLHGWEKEKKKYNELKLTKNSQFTSPDDSYNESTSGGSRLDLNVAVIGAEDSPTHLITGKLLQYANWGNNFFDYLNIFYSF